MKRHQTRMMLASQCLLVLFFFGGICRLASAQSIASSGARDSSDSPAARAMAEPNLALGAIHAELAWLGDPVGFACELEITPNGPGLEARGWVPDETVRAHILQVACKASGAQVSDSLHVDPGRTIRPVNTPSVSLRRAALSAINQVLPSRAFDINLETWGNGQVVLNGKVETYDEKLLASRCMRRVQGCTCVLNRLSVRQPYVLARRSRQDSVGDAPTDLASTPRTPDSGITQAAFRVETNQASGVSPSENAALAQQGGSAVAISTSETIVAPCEPPPGNWAQVTVRRVKAAVGRICSWRPRLPRLFDPSPCTYPEYLNGAATNPTISVSAWAPVTMSRSRSPYNQIDRSPNRTVAPDGASKTTQLQQEPRKLDLAESDSITLASARSLSGPEPISQTRIRGFIASSFERTATNVEVAMQAENMLEIRMRVANARDAEAISDRLIGLAELKPYRISLNISIGP